MQAHVPARNVLLTRYDQVISSEPAFRQLEARMADQAGAGNGNGGGGEGGDEAMATNVRELLAARGPCIGGGERR